MQRTSRKPIVTGIALVALLMVAAASAYAQPVALEGPEWVLSAYGGDSVADAAQTTVQFQDGRMTGNAGCNRYFASYEVVGNKLTISEVGSTMMACPDPIMNQETAYLKLLGTVKGYQVEAGELYLLDGEDSAILEFVVPTAEIISLTEPLELLDGDLYVPLRGLLVWLNAAVEWDEETQTATGTRGNQRLEVTIGSSTANVNGRDVPLTTTTFEINNRTYVPLALLADAFGLVVQHAADDHTLTLLDGARRGNLSAP